MSVTVRRFLSRASFWLLLTLSCLSCKPKHPVAVKPAMAFRQLDSLLRTPSFDYDSMQILLAGLSRTFPHSLAKEKSYDTKSTRVIYRWNTDSTIAMLHASKNLSKGFSREVVVHSGDSILFVYRFNTAPLDIENPDDFTFLESVYYLRNTGTIKYVSRIAYDQSTLADTIAFRQKEFSDRSDPRYHYYSMELSYAQNIFED